MEPSYREWVLLLPAGVHVTPEEGEGRIELTQETIGRFWAETARRMEAHEERGAQFRPPIYASETPHQMSATELGYVEQLRVDEKGGWGLAVLGDTGYQKLQSGELRNVSPGIEPIFDEGLGQKFHSHLCEVSPTTRPRFQSAQFHGDGKELTIAASVAAPDVHLSQHDEEQVMEDEKTDEPDAETSEIEAQDEGSAEASEIEGQDGEGEGGGEMAEVREMVQTEMQEIREQLARLSEAMTKMMNEGDHENDDDSQVAASQPQAGEVDDDRMRRIAEQTVRAAQTSGTTEEVGQPGGHEGVEMTLSQRFDDYDEAYEALKSEHGTEQASRMLRDSSLQPTG